MKMIFLIIRVTQNLLCTFFLFYFQIFLAKLLLFLQSRRETSGNCGKRCNYHAPAFALINQYYIQCSALPGSSYISRLKPSASLNSFPYLCLTMPFFLTKVLLETSFSPTSQLFSAKSLSLIHI